METERNLDLIVIPFPEGTLRTKLEEDNALFRKIKGMGMNLVTLPLETLQVLHQGVLTLLVINEVKMNIEKIFTEKDSDS